jgi:trehalose 6-phosphate phosphatase
MNGDDGSTAEDDGSTAGGDRSTSGDDDPLDDHPSVAPVVEALRPRLERARRLDLLLDFDGTLAPITDEPEAATMLPAAREPLERLCGEPSVDVAVVSGRAAADVAERVDLPDVRYAGNHGFEVAADGAVELHPEAEARRPALADALADLRTRLDDVPGCRIEDKGATATVHYRETPDDRVPAVREAVQSAVAGVGAGSLRVTEGKQILELRPDVDRDKGTAVEHLASDDPSATAMYVGDDRTDEAAFEQVAPDGVGVLVGERADSAAAHAVPGPEAVAALLSWLAGEGVDRLQDR